MFIARLAQSGLSVAKFTHWALLHTACKLQEIRRFTARAPVRLSKAGLTVVMATLARILVVIETFSAVGDAPRGKIGTRAFYASIFAVTTVVVTESA